MSDETEETELEDSQSSTTEMTAFEQPTPTPEVTITSGTTATEGTGSVSNSIATTESFRDGNDLLANSTTESESDLGIPGGDTNAGIDTPSTGSATTTEHAAPFVQAGTVGAAVGVTVVGVLLLVSITVAVLLVLTSRHRKKQKRGASSDINYANPYYEGGTYIYVRTYIHTFSLSL